MNTHIKIGLSALLVCIFSFLGCSKPKTVPSLDKLNVILIMVDTLSAKHTSVYNSELNTTPALKEWASQATVFENAYSTAPWTKPSLSSVFTSLYPSQHKAKELYVPLDLRFDTIPEAMQARGYKTVGYVSHVMLSKKNGFAQGFDEYELMKFEGGVHDSTTAHQVTDSAIAWFDKNGNFPNPDSNNKGSQFFMFLHYFDPHFAYQHHAQYDQTSWYKGPLKPGMNFRYLRENAHKFSADDIKYLVGLYHEEIMYTDYHLGRLFTALKERGIDKNTIVIFIADHGEEFMDHQGMGHSHTLYNELIKVPFIVSLPDVVKAQKVTEPVNTISVWPTLEAFAEKPNALKHWQGQSLKETLITGAKPETVPIFSEVSWDASKGGLSAHKVSVVNNSSKLIFDKRSQVFEYYDLINDSEEKKDLINEEPSDLSKLKDMINKFIEDTKKPVLDFQAGQTGENLHTPEELEQLRSLGYL